MNGEGGHERNELKKGGGTNETHEKETEWCDVHHLYTSGTNSRRKFFTNRHTDS